ARGAVQQARSERLLELADGLAGARAREPELARRSREAAELRDAHEDPQGKESIHGRYSGRAIVRFYRTEFTARPGLFQAAAGASLAKREKRSTCTIGTG